MGLAAAIEKSGTKANGFFALLFPASPFYGNTSLLYGNK
jgi:hypothetical protein